MTRFCIICVAALCASYCAPEVVETSTGDQAGTNQQGAQLQGTSLQGTTLQDTTLLGFQFDGATLGGGALVNLRVQQGELVAEQNQVTLHGASLINTHLYAQVRNLGASPPVTALVEYRIANVVPEDAGYDPTQTGSTFLYTLEQWAADSSSWQPACPVDLDGRLAAIPLAATWDEHGDRIDFDLAVHLRLHHRRHREVLPVGLPTVGDGLRRSGGDALDLYAARARGLLRRRRVAHARWHVDQRLGQPALSGPDPGARRRLAPATATGHGLRGGVEHGRGGVSEPRALAQWRGSDLPALPRPIDSAEPAGRDCV